jgi:hypothetical protein
MKEKNLVSLFLFVWWFSGIAVAAGWWKLIAILIPPYAWYVFMEKLLKSLGVI